MNPPAAESDLLAEAAYSDLRSGVLLRQQIRTWDWPDFADLPKAIQARIASVIRSVEHITRKGGRNRPQRPRTGS